MSRKKKVININDEIASRIEKYPDLPEDEFIPIEFTHKEKGPINTSNKPNYIYLINKKGEIKHKTGTFVKYVLHNGYYKVPIYYEKDNMIFVKVHILVANTFLVNNNPEKFKFVNHIDHVITNNKLSNLEFISICGNNNKMFNKSLPISEDKRIIYVGKDKNGNEKYRFTTLNIPENIFMDGVFYSIKNNTLYRDVYWSKENVISREDAFYKRINCSGNINDYIWYKHPFYDVWVCKEGFVRKQYYINNSILKDEIVGHIKDGYVLAPCKVDGKTKGIFVHKIIEEYLLNRHLDKKEEVDHINGNSLDNSFDNLRIVNHSENMRNIITREKLSKPTIILNLYGDIVKNNISRFEAYKLIFGKNDDDIKNLTGRQIKTELFYTNSPINNRYICLREFTLDYLSNKLNLIHYIVS